MESAQTISSVIIVIINDRRGTFDNPDSGANFPKLK